MKKIIFKTGIFIFLLLVTFAPNSFAVDTTETYDLGASNFEFYSGYGDIGKDEQTMASEVLLGFGFTSIFSGYLAASASTNEHLNSATTENSLNFGLLGTPLDTKYFDLDLLLDIQAFNSFGLKPGLELNFDLASDLKLAGLYFRAEEEITGSEDENNTLYNTSLTGGIYYSFNQDLQFLSEFDWSYDYDAKEDNIGGIALGVNYLVTDDIELISQVYFDIAQDDEDFGWGVDLGFVAALPERK